MLRSFARVLIAALALLGFLVVLVTFTPLVSWWAHRLSGDLTDVDADVLIVLAGDDGSSGFIGYGTYLRTEYALVAYRKGRARAILLSGGGLQMPVSETMKSLLVANGVPAQIILLETQSRSTRENAINSKKPLEAVRGRKVLLTSDYHMFRAQRAFRKAGIEVEAHPIPDVLKRAATFSGRWPGFIELCKETAKIFYYTGRGWI